MRIKTFLVLLILFSFLAFDPNQTKACESCVIPAIGRAGEFKKDALKKPWFFDFTFEQQNWDERPALEAHELHEEGHHVHNKTHEEFYHFTLGVRPLEAFSLLAEIPYVVRGSTEIEDHDRLGEKEQSEGIGDLNLLATLRLLQREENYLGALAGVKFPTGRTDEVNSQGLRFEPELQPGTGSTDYPLGAVYQLQMGSFVFRGNAVYVIKTEGDQAFEFGDLFSTSLFLDTVIDLGGGAFKIKPGFDVNFQHEEKQKDHGERVMDSGGTTLLAGPSLGIESGESFSFFGNILFPVDQNPGGEHQKLDFVWSAGCKISW